MDDRHLLRDGPGQDSDGETPLLVGPRAGPKQESKLDQLLGNALSHLKALEAFEDLGAVKAAPETLAPEIAELETLETALKILAQESAALLAPGEVAARLDELVAGAEATGETVREIEELSRLGEASQRQRATLLQ